MLNIETNRITLSRRAWLQKITAGLCTTSLIALSDSSFANPRLQGATNAKLKGRLKQSACRWCYRNIPLEELAKFASEIGLKGIDLLNNPDDWPVVKKYGLIPTMTSGAGTIADACNRKDLHDKLEKDFQTNIPRAAENGIPNVITFSGNRKGMSDGEGIENTVAILNRVKGISRKTQRHDLHGVAQQQGRSQGLHVRPHGLGRGSGQTGRTRRASSCSTTSTTCRSWRAT